MRSGRVRSAAMQPYPWITGKFNSLRYTNREAFSDRVVASLLAMTPAVTPPSMTTVVTLGAMTALVHG